MHRAALRCSLLVVSAAVLACSSSSNSSSQTSTPSGVHICTDSSTCGGLDCELVNGESQGACVSHCSGLGCATGQVCATDATVGLAASCLVDCSTATCADGFDCADTYAGVNHLCVPSHWW